METQSTVDLELLCAQAPWLRALSRHLVRDPAAAEDIAQETLLAALEAPPADVADARRLRAWLRRVAYNLSHLARRRGMRRRAREERVARTNLQTSTAESVVVNSVKRHVVDAVGTLDEPYRSTIELRYFEGVSTADIAVRMGTTDNAVRKRLYRARRKLRKRLDTVHQGDRLAWFNALLPLAGFRPSQPPAPAVASASAPLSPLALGAAGLAVCGALFAVTQQVRAPRAAQPQELFRAALGVSADLDAGRQTARRPVAIPAREATPAAPGEPSTDTQPPADPDEHLRTVDNRAEALPLLQVAGRVVDLAGEPLSGLAVHAGDSDTPLAWTDPHGRFDVAVDVPDNDEPLRVCARNETFATLQEALVTPESAGREFLIVAARAVNVSGRVVDQDGTPVTGADVRLAADERAFLALDRDLAGTLLARAATHTDEHGYFALRRLPSGPGIDLRAEAAGELAGLFEGPRTTPVPMRDAHDLRLILARAATPPLLLHGIVRFEDGEPAPETLVRLGDRETHTDAAGAFAFRLQRIGPGLALVAERPGYRQVRFPDLSALVRGQGMLALRHDLQVGLVLVESDHELAGHVVDANGTPCAGWIVHAQPCEEDEEPQGDALASTAFTEEDGRFLLQGLLDRPHDLVAYNASTLLSVRSSSVPAGRTDVTLALLPGDDLLSSVSGRVTDELGAPIPGADVRVALALSAAEDVHGSGMHAFRGSTRTDALGYFELFDVPHHSVEIAVRAAGTELHRTLEAAHAHDLAIRIPRAIGIRLAAAPTDAASFAVVDEAGNALPLFGATRESQTRGRLYSGQSILYSTSSTGVGGVILFDEDDDEIGRMTLDAVTRPLQH